LVHIFFQIKVQEGKYKTKTKQKRVGRNTGVSKKEREVPGSILQGKKYSIIHTAISSVKMEKRRQGK